MNVMDRITGSRHLTSNHIRKLLLSINTWCTEMHEKVKDVWTESTGLSPSCTIVACMEVTSK